MKKMRLFIFTTVLMICFLAGAPLISHPPFAAKTKVLRLVVPSPPGDWPLTFMNEEMAKRFNKRAKGAYKIEVHAGGAIAKLPEYFDSVRVGAVEMACAPWGMYSFLDPRLGAIEIPFLFHSSPAGSAACKQLVPLYDKLFQEKFNAKALALYNPGGVQLMSSKPVKTLEDAQGLLVGAISPPTAVLLKELGASPVTIMWTDMYESLQKNVISATTQGTHGAVVMGLMDVCKYVTVGYFISGWNGFSINLDLWNAMPEDIKKILQEEATFSAEWMNRTVVDEVGPKDMAYYEENGVEVHFLSKAERQRWIDKVEPYSKNQIEKLGDFGRQVKKIADDVNARIPYTERGLY